MGGCSDVATFVNGACSRHGKNTFYLRSPEGDRIVANFVKYRLIKKERRGWENESETRARRLKEIEKSLKSHEDNYKNCTRAPTPPPLPLLPSRHQQRAPFLARRSCTSSLHHPSPSYPRKGGIERGTGIRLSPRDSVSPYFCEIYRR